ncbi:ATP-binding protein [Kineosporia succinea]|uniref:DNA-binding SARP family transcriptional activator n=1 Tax=Kineosporia succinea TaxID=84632 RepID=A0ABT9PG81_9ACTN|nr:BTAD domain-containing putative transcriptional regulator [Kineosporia succinea]MDP9830975.1 DNA-binding SARP family transcriptional activator [Kineosporia succinea]
MTVTQFSADTDGRRPAAGSDALRLQVLGPLRVWRGETELETAPRQQAYLLALLLARGGRPTGTGELIDLIWGEEAPASALNVIHKYMGSLRRLLEPDLPPREAGKYLLSRPNGYLWAGGADVLDLLRFRKLAESARAQDDQQTALEHYLEALELWTGPAGDGWAHGPVAAPIFAGLNDEFFRVCVEANEAALALGQAHRVLRPLHRAAAMAPLHEPVLAGLVSALGEAGHQAEALTLFDGVRRRLAEHLGIDPGPALREAHQRVLAPAPAVTRPAVVAPVVVSGPGDLLVGREHEIEVLERALEPALGGRNAVVLLEGEPGAGKSRLLDEVAHRAGLRGAVVVRAHCLPDEGTPTMWPWVETVTELLDTLPPAEREEWLAGDLGHLVGTRNPAAPPSRFPLREQVLDLIARWAGERPVVLMIDDLQWADTSSLHLLDHVIARLPAGTALVATLRNRGPAARLELVRTLAAASRTAGHRRVLVGPLGPDEVARLVHLETGTRPTAEVAALIHARTAGNPFFVRELARLLASDTVITPETVLGRGVPMTVRDVVRDRLTALDPPARELLEIAALVGRSLELPLLARSAAQDMITCLNHLEPLRRLGLVDASPADPFSYRFTHDLVRQAVAEELAPARAAGLHRRIADAIEQIGLDDESVPERVAHHLWAAGPLADPATTVTALVRAGARAAAKTALAAAERHLGSAVELARRSSLPELELEALSQLIAVVGMRSMYGMASASLLERAEQVARQLGREREAAGFLFSRWTAHGQALELDRSTPLARRLDELGRTSGDEVVRAYGQAAAGIHEWCLGNIGSSFRRLSALGAARPTGDPVRDGVQLMSSGLFAEIAAYAGETSTARALLTDLNAAAGDDPYAVTVATSFEARTAVIVGDPGWALHAAGRGITADPDFSFLSLGTYLRLARHWALAMTGADAAGEADAAERLIATHLADPVRTCVSTWYGLLGQMRLAAGQTSEAGAALDRAHECLDLYGQRSAEGLLVLFRAQLARATGDRAGARHHARRARTVALGQEAHLFVRRAEQLLTELG